jgi:N-formylglutamate amidohydrolase
MQNKASVMSVQKQGTIRPDFVVGDKDGKSCNQEFRDEIVNYLRKLNYKVSVNDPYKG